MTDFPDWQAPQAHATSISTTGVPLLTKSTGLYTNPSLKIPGNSVDQLIAIPVTQPGYEVIVAAQVPAAATVPFLEVRLIWLDSATGLSPGDSTFIMPMSSAGLGWQTGMRGPTKADQVQLYLSNLDPAQECTLYVSLLQNSRVYESDRVFGSPVGNTSETVPGWTLPVMPPTVEMLAAVSDTAIGASSSKTWLIPPGSGVLSMISVHTGAASVSAVRTNLYPLPSSLFGTDPPLIPGDPATTDFSQLLIVPRAPMSLQISNLATTAITASWSLTEQI